jgi:hypothetical protein
MSPIFRDANVAWYKVRHVCHVWRRNKLLHLCSCSVYFLHIILSCQASAQDSTQALRATRLGV